MSISRTTVYGVKVLLLTAVSLVSGAEQPASASPNRTLSAPQTYWATRGLVYTTAAATQGFGRLSFGVHGAWYKQGRTFPGAPNEGASVLTGLGSAAIGVNDYIDLFAWAGAFGLAKYDYSNKVGLGSVGGGVQGILPLPSTSPFNMGAQLGMVGGSSRNQINENRADGYNFWETRTGHNVVGKVLESLVFGDDEYGIGIHLNQGFVATLEKNKDQLLMLAGGLQGTLAQYVILGCEVNVRTALTDPTFSTDPFWLTPSLTIRTPYYLSVLFAADISLSKDRVAKGERALEPFRIGGGLTFSFDLLAHKKAEDAERRRKEAAEKTALQNKAHSAEAQADSLARKAVADSLRQKAVQDSMARANEALSKKAKQDSLLLAEAKRRIEEEKSKRTDAEKQLLSTGMLLLDAVYFESGRTEISINSKPYLNIIGKMLAKYPKLMLEVSGHTDNLGKAAGNFALSQARAESVRAYLISVSSDLAQRLTARGYGASVPKASNATADGRKVNRRVEIQVLNKDVLKEYNP